MKTSFVFVFAVAVLALANAKSIEEKVRRFYSEYQEANAITPLSLCMNTKLGFMNENGDIDKDKLKAALSEVPNRNSAVVEDLLAHCGERKGSTAAEAAEAFNKCMRERYVVHYPGSHFST